jgi:UDP-N-acetylglucosamine acyltransferase
MIHPTAIIYPNVKLGSNVYIGAYCIIGAPAEHKAKWMQEGKGVEIMDNAVITGHVTIDSGIEGKTVIGSGAFIMKGVHIGHDSLIGEDVVIAPHVIVGGHCWIGNRCNLGMGAIIRNRKAIPSDVVIGMGTIVTRSCELWEGGTFVGSPASHI